MLLLYNPENNTSLMRKSKSPFNWLKVLVSNLDDSLTIIEISFLLITFMNYSFIVPRRNNLHYVLFLNFLRIEATKELYKELYKEPYKDQYKELSKGLRKELNKELSKELCKELYKELPKNCFKYFPGFLFSFVIICTIYSFLTFYV